MNCKKCGKELNNDEKFCPECGQKVSSFYKDNQSTNKKFNIITTIVSLIVISVIAGGIFVYSANSSDNKSEDKQETVVSNSDDKKINEQRDSFEILPGPAQRDIYSYSNAGTAGLATFAYNITNSSPSNQYYYHYSNNSPFRLRVVAVFPQYIVVGGDYVSEFFRPTAHLLINTDRDYVTGQYLKENTFYGYAGVKSNNSGLSMWAFKEVKLNLVKTEH